jgi:aminoglycoside phosphotransferase (APT) family kinase protein
MAEQPEVDVALAIRLVREQHPDLAGEITLVARGWDNCIFRLGDFLTVRLPRRQEAAQLIVNEQRWLPLISTSTTTAVPTPVRVGIPTDYYPWPWTIGPWFAGEPALDFAPARRTAIAEGLAEFYGDLHQVAPADAPVNPVRGVPLSQRAESVLERLAGGLIPESTRLSELWHRLVSTPVWNYDDVWIHGDPHPGNIIARPMGADPAQLELAAVIDFGDLTSGDPATDLAIAWTTFDPVGRARFRTRTNDLYPTDGDTWLRARGWALILATALIAFSHNDERLIEVGHHTIEQVLIDE